MKYPVRLKILILYGQHTAYFESLEAGTKVLDELSARLAKVREYSNRDEEVVFRFEGAGALYAIDMRKVQGASLEMCDKWGDVLNEESIRRLLDGRAFYTAVDERGLTPELERHEKLMMKVAS